MNLIQTISQDLGMKFGIKKCVMLIMKSRKRQILEKIDGQIKKKQSES